MKTRKKEAAAAVILLALLLIFLTFASAVFLPKRYDYGSTWGLFAAEEKNSLDVMFFGSSLVYCDVIPALLWEDTGSSAYVMAGPEQTIPTTYYYINEVYKTQQPSILFVEVTGVFFPQYTNYTKVNVGYMPWSLNRLQATFHAAEPEQRLGLLFPLYNYHDRWDELRTGDFDRVLLGYDPDPMAGYTFLSNIANVEKGVQPRPVEYDEVNYQNNITYLRKIADLATEKGSKVYFYITPSYWRLDAQYLDMLRSDFAEMDGVTFIDFNENFGALDIDDTTDFFDYLHFNYRGAEKFTHALSQVIADSGIDLPQRQDSALWQQRLDSYRAKAAAAQQ